MDVVIYRKELAWKIFSVYFIPKVSNPYLDYKYIIALLANSVTIEEDILIYIKIII